jgi:hypothetical protein
VLAFSVSSTTLPLIAVVFFFDAVPSHSETRDEATAATTFGLEMLSRRVTFGLLMTVSSVTMEARRCCWSCTPRKVRRCANIFMYLVGLVRLVCCVMLS